MTTRWYVEFHGPELMDEIGTIVDATEPDDAIPKARAKVREGWHESNGGEGDEPLGGNEPVYTFDSWTVARCYRWVD